MTARDGFTRLLDTWLAEEGVVVAPDYLGEVLARTTTTSQRPVWMSPGRWFAMLDIPVTRLAAPRLPIRSLVTAVIIAALLVAALALAGSRSRVPAPYGPARNGLITWALDGDIYVGDPVHGTSRRVVASDDIDRNPIFSRDGTHIAFLRQVPNQTGRFDLEITNADGGSPRTLSAVPISTPETVQWAPDGTSLLVNDSDGRLVRYFADGSPSQAMLQGVHIEPDAFRPPDGAQILFDRVDDQRALYVMHADGSNPHEVFGGRTAPCACAYSGPARWSPDGRTVAFSANIDGLQDRMFVLDVDTGGARQLTDEDGSWLEGDPHWSPDGGRVAFNRYQGDGTGNWTIRPIAVVDVATRQLSSVGVSPADAGALIEWAPDGQSILSLPNTLVEGFKWSPGADGTVARPTLIDIATDESRQLDWSVGSASSWQRLAP